MNTLPSLVADRVLDTATAIVPVVRVKFSKGQAEVLLKPDQLSLTQDRRRELRWDGSMTLSGGGIPLPFEAGDLLTPFGTRITVELGVRLSDGTESCVGYGHYDIDASSVDISPGSSSVQVKLIDLGQKVAGYRFESPFTVLGGADLSVFVNRVIANRTGVSPKVPAVGQLLQRKRVFGTETESDPWRELTSLASSFGYRLYYNRTGSLILDQVPVADSADARMLMREAKVAGNFDRRPANVVVARNSDPDGPPIQAVAMDLDPTSPTYAGTSPGSSPYGRVTKFFASPVLTTQRAANSAAKTVLANEAGAAAAWTVTRPFDPRMDPDDVITVTQGTALLVLVVDSVALNLEGDTTMECRALSTLVE